MISNRYSALFLILFFLGICGHEKLPTVSGRPAPPPPDKSSTPDLKGLKKPELAKVLERLEQAKDVRTLRALLKNPMTASLAAGTYVRLLSAEQAVLFCSSLELGSGVWVSAFDALISHYKEKQIVIGICEADVYFSTPRGPVLVLPSL